MVYFVSSLNPRNARSGIEKRCNMWWTFWSQKNRITWVELPTQWENINLLERVLTRFFFYLLPVPHRLFVFFTGSSLLNFNRQKNILMETLNKDLAENDIIFIFRAYNLYVFTKDELHKIFIQSKNLIVDFDESDYCSLNTFNKTKRWRNVKETVAENEKTILNSSGVKIYVSGQNEIDKIKSNYKIYRQIFVMPNKLLINSDFVPKFIEKPIKIILVGTFAYLPNAEMLHVLIKNVLPSLLNSNDYEFHIVGSGIKTGLRNKLNRFTNVFLYSYISDNELANLYNSMHFSLVLLSSGGGTKYKIVESLAYSTPVIATLESIAGLNLMPYKHFIPFKIETFENEITKLGV